MSANLSLTIEVEIESIHIHAARPYSLWQRQGHGHGHQKWQPWEQRGPEYAHGCGATPHPVRVCHKASNADGAGY